MRQKLRAGLEKLKPESDWSFITTQIGMFAYTGLTAEQVPPSPWSVRLWRQSSGSPAAVLPLACRVSPGFPSSGALRRLFCLLASGRPALAQSLKPSACVRRQVGRLGSEFNIFMLKSGRISMAGVSSATVGYLAESIAKVL